MFIAVGKRYVNLCSVAHILLQEHASGAVSYRFTFLQDTTLDYRSDNKDEIAAIAYAISQEGRVQDENN